MYQFYDMAGDATGVHGKAVQMSRAQSTSAPQQATGLFLKQRRYLTRGDWIGIRVLPID
jgi:hypothetical protein